MAISIAVESPLQDEVRVLIAALNATLRPLSPSEYANHLSVEDLANTTTTMFIGRDNGCAVACGALRRYEGDIGEVKRMYTQPSARGRGIGGMLLAEIEALARNEGLTRLVLESGHLNHAARRIYERAGFNRCGPVLAYLDIPYSVFYEKKLDA